MVDSVAPPRTVSGKLAVGIAFVPWIFAWFTLRDGYSNRARQLSLGWMAVTILFSVLGRSRHDAQMSAQMPVPRTPALAAAPAPVGLPITLVRRDDSDTPIKAQRSRTILIPKKATREEVRDSLLAYYAEIRNELSRSDNDTKHIYIYAFDDERRAKRGDGEWVGMAMAKAFSGNALPQEPDLTLKVPDPAEKAPTADEQNIYDEYLDALDAVPLAQQGSPESEERIKKVVGKRHGLSPKQMTDLYVRVFTYRNTQSR